MPCDAPTPVPPFLSLDFHLRFFPAVLWRRIKGSAEADRSSFSNHLPLEMPVLLAVCLVLVIIGVPLGVGAQPLLGWALTALGLGGAVFLAVNSIGSRPAGRPGYETFHVMVCLFCVTLGLTAGLLLAAHPPWAKVPGAVLGALAGYSLGILAGRWIEYLGWIALVPDLLAIVGTAGLAIFDVLFIWS